MLNEAEYFPPVKTCLFKTHIEKKKKKYMEKCIAVHRNGRVQNTNRIVSPGVQKVI